MRGAKRVAAALAATAFFLSVAEAGARDWPVKPVRIVVPYGAGGAADTMARLVADALSTAFGQPFVVENRPGGGSLVGTEIVARSPPDGYTLALSGMSTHVLAPAMNKNVSFDPVGDFTQIAYLGGAPNIFVVHPSFGARTFKDFLTRARAGESIDYVSPGVGSVGNLIAEYLATKENIRLVHIAYRGGAGALLDLVAGHLKVGMMSLSTAREHVRTGSLVPIAVSSDARPTDLPQVPTLKELGYGELVATTWWTLSAPAGLPAEIVDRINGAVADGLQQPRIRKHLEQEGVQTRAMTSAEVTQFVRSEVEKWVPFVRTAIRPN